MRKPLAVGMTLLMLTALSVRAGTYTWTPTAAGTYNWDDATSQWSSGFPNAADDIANLNIDLAGAQTIHLNQSITSGTINLGDQGEPRYGVTIDGNGGALTMDVSSGTASIARTGGNGAVDIISANIQLNDSLVVSDATGSMDWSAPHFKGVSISGNISGDGMSLTKDGAGLLSLTGANTFNGGVTLNSGVLAVGDSALAGGCTLTINGGWLQGANGNNTLVNNSPMVWSGDFGIGWLSFDSGAGAITLTTNITLTVTHTVNIGGTITGPAGLNLFDVTVNYSGNTTPTFSTPVVLRSNQTWTVDTDIWTVNCDGVISDAGNGFGFNKGGTGPLVLNGANTYSGDTTISGGSLTIGNNLALQNSALNTASSTVALAVGTPTLGGLIGSVDLASVFSSGYDSVTALTLNPGEGHTNTYSGVIANGVDNMTLTKTGAGSQVLAGLNTYTGGTTVNGGILNFAPGSSNATAGLSVYAGSTAVVETAAGVVSDTGMVDLRYDGLNYGVLYLGAGVNEAAGTLYLDGVQQVDGSWGATGSGAANTNDAFFAGPGMLVITGGLVPVEGSWNIDGSGNWDTTANWLSYQVPLGTDATARFTCTISANRTAINTYSPLMISNLVFGSPSFNWEVTGNTIQMNGTITVNRNQATISSTMEGSGAVTKIGVGTLALTGANSFNGGMILDNGVLAVGDYALAGDCTLTINGGWLRGANGDNTLMNNNPMVWNGDFTIGMGAFDSGTGAITLETNITMSVVHGVTIGGTITGPGGLNAFDVSFDTLGGANSGLLLKTPVELRSNQTVRLISGWGVQLDGIISDGGNGYGITKEGAGALSLCAANTYSGDTTISGGRLNIGHSLALQNSALNTAPGTVALSVSAPTLGGLIGSEDLASVFSGYYGSMTALTLSPGEGRAPVYSGTIADGGDSMMLIKTGAGTQVLGGNNTYSGGTTVNGGILDFSAGSSNATASLTVYAGSTCIVETAVGAVSDNGMVTLRRSGSSYGVLYLTNGISETVGGLSFDGVVQATGSWGATGSGAANTNDDYFAGSGTLVVNGTVLSEGYWNVDDGGDWDVTSNWLGDQIPLGADATARFTYPITADRKVTNTYSTLTNGSLVFGSPSFDWEITGNKIEMNGTIAVNNNQATISSALTGSGSVTKTGGGTLVLTGSNTFSGGLNFTAGRLMLGGADGNCWATGTGMFTIRSGLYVGGYNPPVTIMNNTPITLLGDFTACDIGFGTGPVTITNSLALTVYNGVTFDGVISGPGGLNAIDISGISQFGVGYDLTLGGPITLSSNQTVRGNGETISGVIGDDGNGYGLEVAVSPGWDPAWGGYLALDAANTYSGDTTVSSGMLKIRNDLALQNSALNTAAGIATLYVTTPTIGGLKGGTALTSVFKGGYDSVTTLTLNPVAGHTNVYSGVIADGAAGMTLAKTGDGVQALTRANTYTGPTTISGGTLVLTDGSLANTAISVSGTGVLAVQPGNATTINLGSTAVPGAGATLDLGNRTFDMTDGAVSTCNLLQDAAGPSPALTIADGAMLRFNLGESGADLLAVTMDASVSGTVNVALDFGGAAFLRSGRHDLVTAASGLTSGGATWQFMGGGTRQRVTVAGNDYDLTLRLSDTAVSVTVVDRMGTTIIVR